jgi:hypothetical protein
MSVKTEVKPQVETKAETEAKPDVGFCKKFEAVRKAETQAGSKYAAVVRYVIAENIDRKTILASLVSMGKSPASAHSIATRIMNLTKPENEKILKALEAGEVKVSEVRKKTERRIRTNEKRIERNNESKFADHLARAIAAAKALGMTKEEFDSAADKAWNIGETEETEETKETKE